MEARRAGSARCVADTKQKSADIPGNMEVVMKSKRAVAIAQTAPTQIPPESPSKPRFAIRAESRFRTPTFSNSSAGSKKAPFLKNGKTPPAEIGATKLDGKPIRFAQTCYVQTGEPTVLPRERIVASATPRVALNAFANGKNNLSETSRFESTDAVGGVGIGFRTKKPASTFGNAVLGVHGGNRSARNGGKLFKTGFTNIKTRANELLGDGLQQKKTLEGTSIGVPSAKPSAPGSKKRTLTARFPPGNLSFAAKVAQRQSSLAVESPLQKKSFGAESPSNGSTKATKESTQGDPLLLSETGSRSTSWKCGNIDAPSSLTTRKKRVQELELSSKTLMPSKRSKATGSAATTATNKFPSTSCVFGKRSKGNSAKFDPTETESPPHVIPMVGEDEVNRQSIRRGIQEQALKKSKSTFGEVGSKSSKEPGMHSSNPDSKRVNDSEEFLVSDTDQINSAEDDEIVLRIKSVQDFIHQVSNAQCATENQILDINVTIGECLLDILTDIIAEEGGIGLHEVCTDPDVDCDVISHLMESQGIDEAKGKP